MPWIRKDDKLQIVDKEVDFDPSMEVFPSGETKWTPAFLELDQFYSKDGHVFCFRPKCAGCQWETTCNNEEVIVPVGPGMNVRRGIIAAPGYVLVDIDYSGIELRLAAEFSREPVWVDAFVNGEDLHAKTACTMFRVEKPTKKQRKNAKVCNFNLLYLGGPSAIQQKTLCSWEEAEENCNLWWGSLTKYEPWCLSQWEYAKKHRGVHTHFGRFRNMDKMIKMAEIIVKEGLKSHRQGFIFARRTALNSCIQGTSADLMKLAMVKVNRWIEKNNLETEVQILLTVHDELLLQARDDEYLEERARTISSLMCPDPSLTGWIVPILTEIDLGYNWAEAEGIDSFLSKRNKTDRRANFVPLALRDKVLLDCDWDLKKNGNKDRLTCLLDEIMIESERATDEVKVPLLLQTIEKSGPTKEIGRVAESVVRRTVLRFPGLSIRET